MTKVSYVMEIIKRNDLGLINQKNRYDLVFKNKTVGYVMTNGMHEAARKLSGEYRNTILCNSNYKPKNYKRTSTRAKEMCDVMCQLIIGIKYEV